MSIRLPDPASSRAVLIGASSFPNAPDLPSLSSVRANLVDLRQHLADPSTGGFGAGHCVVLDAQDTTVHDVGRAVSAAASQATDLLLVYYTGHGLVDEHGRLYLALPGTEPGTLRYSALPADSIGQDIANSRAAARVLVLDCGSTGLTGRIDTPGIYTIIGRSPAVVVGNASHTAFTGALLGALDQPEPLSLDQLYDRIDGELLHRDLPRPQRSTADSASDHALVRGPYRGSVAEWAPGEEPDPPTWGREPAPVRSEQRGSLAVTTVGTPLLGIGAAIAFHLGATVVGTVLTVLAAFFLFGVLGTWATWVKRGSVTQVLVDARGITGYRLGAEAVFLPWSRVRLVGVLRPLVGDVAASNRKVYAANHTLAIKLESATAEPPGLVRLMPEQLRQLGYVAPATLETLRIDRGTLLTVLDRYAGNRVVHSDHEWPARDPRFPADLL